MKTFHQQILTKLENKSTLRPSPFIAVEYQLFYESDTKDKELIDKVIRNAKEMAKGVNPNAANDGIAVRTETRRIADLIAGILSEYFWRKFLNESDKIVDYTKYEGSYNQIDLKVIKNNKTIEVRSSIVNNGIQFAISHPTYQFDIIGPYVNEYKSNETIKDYYVRALFHLQSPEQIISEIIKDNFSIFLTGGATKQMMSSVQYYYTKTLKENEVIGSAVGNTNYRLIKFDKAYDTIQIRDVIIDSLK